MVLALNVSVYFCKLLPLHMNGNLPVGIGMHVFAMICDLIFGNYPLLPLQVPGTQDKRFMSWVDSVWRQFFLNG
eukprot:UN0167